MSSMKLLSRAASLVGAIMITVSAAGAQSNPCDVTVAGGTCNVENTASVTITPLLRLTLSSITTTLAPAITADDLFADASVPADAATWPANGAASLTATVTANQGWSLGANTTSDVWTKDAAASTKPASHLAWSTDNTVFTAFSDAAATTNFGTGAAGSTMRSINYKSAWRYSDGPGAYAIVVRYTLTAD